MIWMLLFATLFILWLFYDRARRSLKDQDHTTPYMRRWGNEDTDETSESKTVTERPSFDVYDSMSGLDEYDMYTRLHYFGDMVRTTVMPDFPELTYDMLVESLPMQKGEYASIGERISIEMCERLFKSKFDKVRPSWLKNDMTGRNMELDGYCEALKMAVEYNGIQHYETGAFCDEKGLCKQVYRDKRKADICVENGIFLLIIPHTIAYSKIRLFVYARLLSGIPGAEDIFTA